jgi:EAL domain-containing protein (putative c-di-GMP-specific phosphodiesterase class I)
VGVEALIRWQHPRRGLLPPGKFIDVAEDSGLIVPIGEWVLETRARRSRRGSAREAGLRLSVNLSVGQVVRRRAALRARERRVGAPASTRRRSSWSSPSRT